MFPEAKYLRCTVHFNSSLKGETGGQDTQSDSLSGKQETRPKKAKAMVEELRSVKLKEVAKKLEEGIKETLTYYDFPSEHWTRAPYQQCH